MHEQVCEKLERVEAGDIRRLMIFIPPQHGKSDMASRNFPAWCLGRNPDRRMIQTSYAAALAHSLSRDARRILSTVGPELWDVHVSQESHAVSHWEIAGHRGRLHSAGVGGPVTGHGAEITTIDDPHKGMTDARNRRRTRDLFENWYQAVLRPRSASDGAIVLVMTRFDRWDLAGWLLDAAKKGGEKWEVLELPAMAEENDPLGRAPGEPLWPDGYDLAALAEIKSTTRGYVWNAVHQQQPEAEVKDALWTSQMIDDLRVSEAPELVRVVVAIDPAVTANEDSDETGIIVAGIDAQSPPHAYILADRSGVETPAGWARVAVGAVDRYKADAIVGEVNNGGDLVEANIRGVDPNVRFIEVRASRGKAVRSEPAAAQYELGRVHHVGPLDELEAQLVRMTPSGYRGEDSPDRLDAAVWALWALLLNEDDEPRIRRL